MLQIIDSLRDGRDEITSKLYFNSPLGIIEIVGGKDFISSLYFVEKERQTINGSYVQNCRRQLEDYFEGKRRSFDLRLAPEGTDFQKRVWAELINIPYGATESYLDITKKLGDVKAIRAVANANGQNKISIIIPCHRVIGSDGSLTGYGGGLWRKKWLLEHEHKYFLGEKQLVMQF